ncbi:MAG: hypothetical protein IKR19_07740 [Acholeplasmatales bacterium]|nr:hypothetical protein [Acholeplasmatales bacterium]
MTPHIVNPNNKPIVTQDTHELVQELKNLDNKINSAKGLDKIKLKVERCKIANKLASNNFKTY